jgi:hypothetical protein
MESGGKKAALAGKLNGDGITFTIDGMEYSGRVVGDSISGTAKSAAGEIKWSAIRAQ